MNAKDVLKLNLNLNRMVLSEYLKDMSDADPMVRPVPAANHIAWQLGHLISSECEMLSSVGHKMPALPEGFAESHSKEASKSEDQKKFLSRKQYLDLLERVRQGTFAALEKTPESDFDK